MSRLPQRQVRRTGPSGTRAPLARTPHAAVLDLQAMAGNAAVAQVIARAPTSITGAAEHHQRALKHYAAGRFEEARAEWAAAYQDNPISTFLRDQGDALEHLGRFEEAAKLYEQYLADGPITTDIARYRSRIRKLRGEDIPEGEDDDEPAIKGTGKDAARQWFDRGQSAYKAHRYGKAADAFREANQQWVNPQFIYNEGSALEAGKHLRAAANAYEHYLVADPAAKDQDKLIAKIKQLRADAPAQGPNALIDPEDEPSEMPAVASKGKRAASEYFDRAQVAWKLGDFHRAYEDFVAAYDNLPAPDFVFNQAACLDMLGNADAAVQAYERYLALAPNAKDVAKVRKRIALLRANPGAAGPRKAANAGTAP
jgi:tetratricopeptide (TPR) repeat protein